MSFFFFGNKPKTTSVLLVDIASSSIGAAYAKVSSRGPVAMLYTTRKSIPTEPGGLTIERMLRTLDEVLAQVREEGAPIVRRRTGRGNVDAVHASVSTPWQMCDIHTEVIADKTPFVFTNALVEKIQKGITFPKGYTRTKEQVLGTVVNGYPLKNPVGKKGTRAEIIILNAGMPEEIAKLTRRALASFASPSGISFTCLPSSIYSALPKAFPHEKDYIALRVGGEVTELVMIKQGFPNFFSSVPLGLNTFVRAAKGGGFQSFPDGGNLIDQTKSVALETKISEAEIAWTDKVGEAILAFAAKNALPRTLFLLCDPEARDFVRRMIDTPSLHTLWLSDEPLTIIPLESKQVSTMVVYEVNVEEDLALTLLGLTQYS